MSNNDVKIDHEAAKRYAAYIGDMARDHVCGQDDVNLSAAYLDAMARLERVEATLKLIQHDADAKAFTAQKGSDLEYYCAKFARMADAALSENTDVE